jgi:hypothetical protein
MKDNYGNLVSTSFTSSQCLIGQKLRPDSSLVWPGFDWVIVTVETPFYEQYTLTSGPGKVAFPFG